MEMFKTRRSIAKSPYAAHFVEFGGNFFGNWHPSWKFVSIIKTPYIYGDLTGFAPEPTRKHSMDTLNVCSAQKERRETKVMFPSKQATLKSPRYWQIKTKKWVCKKNTNCLFKLLK